MKSILTLVMLLVGTSAFAAAYGDAGCGLGSLVFGDEKGFSQVFAATTNGTGVQTFGITSGTSNCVDQGAIKGAKAVPMFIEVNKVALAKDAARGEGETLAGLANLMGCNSKNLGPALKQNYKSIFVESKMDPSVIETEINQVVTQNHQACGA
jgi:Protein of unknown function (DUF3015)